MFSRLSILALLTSVALGAVACHDIPTVREESANRTAMPVFMIPRDIVAGNFTLKSFERVYKKHQPVNLYIEGDGVPYADQDNLNFFNTPTDPVGVRLAAQDGNPNVISLARPCQYLHHQYGSKPVGHTSCDEKYTTTMRFAPEVIASYNKAIDNIKAYHDVDEFNIIGYDGGGAIAAILAATRPDILTLRTVAGNLDHKTTSYLNKVTFLDGSLNAIDYTAQLKDKPQRHFVGKLDHVIPPAVYSSYAQALGDSQCNAVTLVDNADHERGWVEQWKTLKDLPVACNAPAPEPMPVPFDPSTLDGDKGMRGKFDHVK